jgi:hypothetical protein
MRKQIEKVAQEVVKPIQHIRILINERTIVTVIGKESLDLWLKRFPAARVLPE